MVLRQRILVTLVVGAGLGSPIAGQTLDEARDLHIAGEYRAARIAASSFDTSLEDKFSRTNRRTAPKS